MTAAGADGPGGSNRADDPGGADSPDSPSPDSTSSPDSPSPDSPNSSGSTATVEAFTRRLPAMVDDLRDLVACESPSTDPDALARSAALVAAQGRRLLGAAPELLVVGGRTHLRWRFGSAPSRVLLVGHHDTVHPVGTLARMPWSVTDGIARGPGCFDMKAGLVLIFHALASLSTTPAEPAAADLDGVAVLVSADEELGSPTARDLLAQTADGCAAALVTEPSAGGALKTSRKGIAQYEISIAGRAAHAGLEPQRGINATVELAHQALALAALSAPELGTTVTPTVVRSGDTVNTVPDRAVLCVDARTSTRAEQHRVHTAVTGLVGVLPGIRFAVRCLIAAPPLEPAASAGLFELAGEVAAGLGLSEPFGAGVGGASDGNQIAALGVPTLDGLGAVGGGAHTLDEHVVVAELPRAAALLAGLVTALR